MATITNTEGLIALMDDAAESRKKRRGNGNRQATPEAREALDPDGTHLLAFKMIHNDVELRTQWFVKVKDQTEPETLWLDVSFDAFRKWTRPYEKESV